MDDSYDPRESTYSTEYDEEASESARFTTNPESSCEIVLATSVDSPQSAAIRSAGIRNLDLPDSILIPPDSIQHHLPGVEYQVEVPKHVPVGEQNTGVKDSSRDKFLSESDRYDDEEEEDPQQEDELEDIPDEEYEEEDPQAAAPGFEQQVAQHSDHSEPIGQKEGPTNEIEGEVDVGAAAPLNQNNFEMPNTDKVIVQEEAAVQPVSSIKDENNCGDIPAETEKGDSHEPEEEHHGHETGGPFQPEPHQHAALSTPDHSNTTTESDLPGESEGAAAHQEDLPREFIEEEPAISSTEGPEVEADLFVGEKETADRDCRTPSISVNSNDHHPPTSREVPPSLQSEDSRGMSSIHPSAVDHSVSPSEMSSSISSVSQASNLKIARTVSYMSEAEQKSHQILMKYVLLAEERLNKDWRSRSLDECRATLVKVIPSRQQAVAKFENR